MNSIETLTFVTTFATNILFASPGQANCQNININENPIAISAIKNSCEKIFNDADNYLVQLLVQSRYNTAESVVWVYGCADKN